MCCKIQKNPRIFRSGMNFLRIFRVVLVCRLTHGQAILDSEKVLQHFAVQREETVVYWKQNAKEVKPWNAILR